jgi:hypothetical protein
MVGFEQNGASSAPTNDEHEIIHENHGGSDASSETKAENPGLAEGENIVPHTSHHPKFGDNQVFTPPDNDNSEDLPNAKKVGTYDKIELIEDMCYDELGYAFPSWKKW